jgi:hypothetical protein
VNLPDEIGHFICRNAIIRNVRGDDIRGQAKQLCIHFFGHGAILLHPVFGND